MVVSLGVMAGSQAWSWQQSPLSGSHAVHGACGRVLLALLACAWACGCWSGVVEMAESRLNAGIKMADMRLFRRVDISYGMVILVSLVQFGWYAWLVRSDGKILSCLQSRYTLSAVLDALWWRWSPTIFSLSRSIPGRHYHSLPSIDAKCPSHAITALLGVISRKQSRPDPSRKAYSNRT